MPSLRAKHHDGRSVWRANRVRPNAFQQRLIEFREDQARSASANAKPRRQSAAWKVCQTFSPSRDCSLFCFFQQLNQFIFPQRRERVAAVTARFFAERTDDSAAMRAAFDLASENAEALRIGQV